MILHTIILIHFGLAISARVQDDSTNLNDLFGDLSPEKWKRSIYLIDDERHENNVKIQVYYESLCPGCRYFLSEVLSPTVVKLNQYLNIYLYPYGGAKTTEKDGHYEFQCQHGPLECYGNKLHACAIDILKNMTTSVLFNGCMMVPSNNNDGGSDDSTADECGRRLKIDSEPIKECAKGERGSILLKQYGDETKKANLKYVPYSLINGKESVDSDFLKEVCAAFVIPPPPCNNEPSVKLIKLNDIRK